jgi:glutamate synthase domain-containing protein 1
MGEVDEQAHRATQGARGRNPRREQDAGGVGFVARASGERSHEVLNLARVAHRGAASTDNSGDGAGLLTQIPHRLFWDEAAMLDLPLKAGQPFAVGAFCASDELDER